MNSGKKDSKNGQVRLFQRRYQGKGMGRAIKRIRGGGVSPSSRRGGGERIRPLHGEEISFSNIGTPSPRAWGERFGFWLKLSGVWTMGGKWSEGVKSSY